MENKFCIEKDLIERLGLNSTITITLIYSNTEDVKKQSSFQDVKSGSKAYRSIRLLLIEHTVGVSYLTSEFIIYTTPFIMYN